MSIPILPLSGSIKISDIRTLDSNVVHINNNETINGIKSFNTIQVNNLISSNGSKFISQYEVSNFSSTSNPNQYIPYNFAINFINSYIQIPIGTIIKTNIPINQFVSINSSTNLLQFSQIGGYNITYNISFTVDAVGINTLYFSIDGIYEKKQIMTNITNYIYSISFTQFYDITTNPTAILLYLKTNQMMNISINNLLIDIVKIY